jgi:LPS sulfotransferase NodH
VNFDLPFPPEEAALVRETYAAARVILEYGSGGSTQLAASMPGKYVMAVESDRTWAVDLQLQIDKANLPSPALVWHVGALTETGHAHRYPSAIWTEGFFHHPDLILIGGPMRGACLATVALRIASPVTVLFEGWEGHPDRARCERIAQPVRTVGQMAEFRLAPRPSEPWLQDLLADLCHAVPGSGRVHRAPPEADDSPLGPPVRRLGARPKADAPAGLFVLFREGWGGRALRFLEANRDRTVLLATPAFHQDLQETEAVVRQERGTGYDFSVLPLTPETRPELHQCSSRSDPRLFIVADPDDESKQLLRLRQAFPALRFIGLARDLVPALVAQANHAVFAEIPAQLKVQTATIVFATPRSGSSLLADLLTDIGAGRVIEHLRDGVIGILASGYVFDRTAALRNFLNFASVKGHFGTKIISHFLQDYLTQIDGLAAVLDEVCAGLTVRVIFLDRADTVAQAISGYTAWQRGMWHVTSPAEEEKLRHLPKPVFRFPEALAWYLDYVQQSRFINLLQPAFPEAITLSYEDDLLNKDLEGLGQRLAGFIGLPPGSVALRKVQTRQRLADDLSLEMAETFRHRFHRQFSTDP